MAQWLLTDAEWLDDPFSEIAGDAVKCKPRPSNGAMPIYPEYEVEAGVSQAARTLAYQEFSILEKQAERCTRAWYATIANKAELKETIKDPALFKKYY
jgi:hypothetical protein